MTTQLGETLVLLFAALQKSGHCGALVGGIAVSVRTEPRFTRDVDLVVAVADDRAAEALVRHIGSAGFVPAVLLEQEAVGRLATVRFAKAGCREQMEMVADLLFASSGIEHEIVEAAEKLQILPGVSGPVARTGHLVALKLLARDDRTRPQDAADLRALLAVASSAELALARRACELIMQRGYARGRDLVVSLDTALADNDQL
jgi:predicted nucleotidyltransferase